MESLLKEYQIRYSKPLFKTEKVATSRRFLAISHILSPKIADLANGTYTYLRVLDDMVDEATLVVPVKALLENEKRALLKQDNPTELQQYYLDKVLSNCESKKRDRINSCLAQVVSGLMIDLRIRYTQKPLNDKQLRVRNYLDLWPDIVAFSVGVFGKDLSSNSQVWDLMHAWGSYDNLSDLTEDLTSGLVLINRDDLVENNLSFKPHKELPNDDLRKYYNKKRWQIIKSLRQSSPAIFRVGLSPLVACLGYLYFQRVQLKLLNPLRINDKAIYNPPLDALSNAQFCL